MARAEVTLDARQYDAITEAMQRYGEGCGQIIDNVLHTQGGRILEAEIMRLLPESGRKWRGKATAAKHAQPFTQENGELSVTIKTVSKYHYLYFPDDGSNTRRHRGYKGVPRDFMKKSVDNKGDMIIDMCISELTKKWGE